MRSQPSENISNTKKIEDEMEWEIDYTNDYAEVSEKPEKLGPGWEPFSVVLIPGYCPELRIYWRRKVQ